MFFLLSAEHLFCFVHMSHHNQRCSKSQQMILEQRSSGFLHYYSPVLTNGRLFRIKSLVRVNSSEICFRTYTNAIYRSIVCGIQTFTRVFARNLVLSVENVHSLERYCDRRSGSSNSYLTLCALLHWERRSLYAIDRYLLALSAGARHTTHLYSWEQTVWNYVRNRELRYYRRRAKSGPSYNCGNDTASRYYEYTQHRDILPSPPSIRKLSMNFLVAHSCSQTCFTRILFRFINFFFLVFISHDGEQVMFLFE